MNIIIAGTFSYPTGNASSAYICNVCKLLTSIGHEVTVIGCKYVKNEKEDDDGIYNGILYYNYPYYCQSKIKKYCFEKLFPRYIISKSKLGKKTDILFLYDCKVPVSKPIVAYCKNSGIAYGAFLAEWYSRECFGPQSKKRDVENLVNMVPFNLKHAKIAILISTLLYKSFYDAGINAVWLPNIVDMNDDKWRVGSYINKDEKLTIAYAGSPSAGKDEIGVFLSAIELLEEERRKNTIINLYGIDNEQLIALIKGQRISDKVINENVVCHGRIPQNDIPQKINGNHFTILIRESTLRNNAGFSTKMVESLACGVPMIATLTGDMDKYLKDSVNSVIVNNPSIEGCAEAINRAWELLSQIDSMRKAAQKTAQQYFHYSQYYTGVSEFLNRVEKEWFYD